jgi:hypothetical protein
MTYIRMIIVAVIILSPILFIIIVVNVVVKPAWVVPVFSVLAILLGLGLMARWARQAVRLERKLYETYMKYARCHLKRRDSNHFWWATW